MKEYSAINEMKRMAVDKKEEIINNPNASEEDKKCIDDIIEFLKYEDSFNKVPKSTIFAMLRFLGYKRDKYEMVYYEEVYNKLLEEANKKYTFIDPEELRGNDGKVL